MNSVTVQVPDQMRTNQAGDTDRTRASCTWEQDCGCRSWHEARREEEHKRQEGWAGAERCEGDCMYVHMCIRVCLYVN